LAFTSLSPPGLTTLRPQDLKGFISGREFRLRAPPWGGRVPNGGRGRWVGIKKLRPRRPLLLQPPREGGLPRRLGARSRCFCCLDPIPPLRGGALKNCAPRSIVFSSRFARARVSLSCKRALPCSGRRCVCAKVSFVSAGAPRHVPALPAWGITPGCSALRAACAFGGLWT